MLKLLVKPTLRSKVPYKFLVLPKTPNWLLKSLLTNLIKVLSKLTWLITVVRLKSSRVVKKAPFFWVKLNLSFLRATMFSDTLSLVTRFLWPSITRTLNHTLKSLLVSTSMINLSIPSTRPVSNIPGLLVLDMKRVITDLKNLKFSKLSILFSVVSSTFPFLLTFQLNMVGTLPLVLVVLTATLNSSLMLTLLSKLLELLAFGRLLKVVFMLEVALPTVTLISSSKLTERLYNFSSLLMLSWFPSNTELVLTTNISIAALRRSSKISSSSSGVKFAPWVTRLKFLFLMVNYYKLFLTDSMKKLSLSYLFEIVSIKRNFILIHILKSVKLYSY